MNDKMKIEPLVLPETQDLIDRIAFSKNSFVKSAKGYVEEVHPNHEFQLQLIGKYNKLIADAATVKSYNHTRFIQQRESPDIALERAHKEMTDYIDGNIESY
jgi:hypothetical protein